MDLSALHGLAVVLLPMVVIALLKRDVAQASIATLAYTAVAYALDKGLASVPEAIASGVVTGLQISSIIFTAIYFYNVQRELGVEDELRRIFGNARGVALYLAVFFSGFVESFSGYGVSPAVAAPLLLSLGLPPLQATAAALIGHVWAVPFASLGVPTVVLAELAGAEPGALAEATAVFGALSLAVIVAVVAFRYLGRSLKETAPALLVASALALLAPLTRMYSAAVVGFLGLVTGLLLASGSRAALSALRALRYYLALIAMLFAANLAGFGGLRYTFIVILAAALLSQALERRLGREALRRSVKMTVRSIIAVTLFAAVAELVKRGGYMRSLALLLASSTGRLYALFVPIVGALGAYATGSATTSNLIFAVLQRSYADAVGLSSAALLALQNVGGGLGGMVSPAKISVAASTTAGRELERPLFREGWRALSLVILPQVLLAAALLVAG